ncbi:MAG TPA: monovalent cation/H+ antiporter complex subunit F [Luteimicrobium sp.]|jgi:multicomponent Na+:H+ antiporter subunit F|nr:monovalent cation/H+ antiporter complex subunit F [Luteimicrobium sp.]
MTVVFVVTIALLTVAAGCAIYRAERGPSMLDRTVALDVFTTTIVGAIALEAAYARRATTIPILVVMSLVAFVGSVTVARFAAVEREEEGRIELPPAQGDVDAADDAGLAAAEAAVEPPEGGER